MLILIVLGSCVFLMWPASLTETDIFIPVKPEKIPDGLTLSSPFPKGIEIRVSGPKSTIKTLKNHTLQYILDLSGAEIGDLAVPISKDVISLPPDVTIMKINPSFLTVSVEKEIIKIVPVNVSLLNKPAAGHIISKITAVPASVTLKGPQILLKKYKTPSHLKQYL
ncbi:MAG: YbbR-like domain-containing protein [Deltaproteobacteria bacterium]|nr:YbbR-like domain-containing protein [Deltaproteobacteria bacterium]